MSKKISTRSSRLTTSSTVNLKSSISDFDYDLFREDVIKHFELENKKFDPKEWDDYEYEPIFNIHKYLDKYPIIKIRIFRYSFGKRSYNIQLILDFDIPEINFSRIGVRELEINDEEPGFRHTICNHENLFEVLTMFENYDKDFLAALVEKNENSKFLKSSECGVCNSEFYPPLMRDEECCHKVCMQCRKKISKCPFCRMEWYE